MSTSTTISGMGALGAAPASNDLMPVVDVSDPSEAPAGTTKKMTVANLLTAPSMTTVTISAGNLGIGGAPVTAAGISIASTGLATTSQVGILNRPVFSSAATASGRNIDVLLTTQATAFTMVSGAGIYVNTPSIGAGSAITTIHGVFIDNQTGGTNNFALFCNGKNDVVLNGSGTAVATNATVGFTYIPNCAGTPTGTPAANATGRTPIIYDTAANKFWAFNGSWRSTAALT